jgi:hypothetical protein
MRWTQIAILRIREACQNAPFLNVPACAALFRTEHHWKSPSTNLTDYGKVNSAVGACQPKACCRFLLTPLDI